MNRAARLAALVAFPIALLHELGHYFAAVPWARDARVVLDPAGGSANTYIDFDDDAPRWAIGLACVFPTVVGVGVGAVALVWWGLNGLSTPGELVGWFELAAAGLSWGVFTWPSPGDIDGARNGPEEADLRGSNPGGEAS